MNAFYKKIIKNINKPIKIKMKSGYGNLVFYGWEDVNGYPVDIIFIRTEGT